ncbi:MAG: hypothetical protein PUI05_03485 [Peptoniphilaceae bacterium]|nr:hypothetical protein [Peptoniphilaceae bacterium]
MRKFKDLSIFIIKRFYLLLIPALIFLVIVLSFGSRNTLKSEYQTFINNINEMKEDIEKDSFGEDIVINDDLIKETRVVAFKFKDKYKLMSGRELESVSDAEATYYYERINNTGHDGQNLTYNSYQYFIEKFNEKGLNPTSYYENLLGPIMVFIIIFSIIITSLEQSMPIYEFTRMLPWNKREDLAMKVVFTFLLSLFVYVLNLIFVTFALKSSAFGTILDYTSLINQIVRDILILLATSIITTSLGFIAGNFLGHIGLGFMAFTGIHLINFNIVTFLSIFSLRIYADIDMKYNDFIRGLDSFPATVLSLSNLRQDNINSILAFLLVSLIVFAIAYFTSKKFIAERSGYMVISKPIAMVCKFFGVLTLANMVTSITLSVFMEVHPVVGIILFAICLLFSYKFFDIIFKIKLKF